VEDKEIIDLYFARSEDAIQRTDGKYGLYLKHLANSILHSYEDSEEVVDDTYMKAWDSMPPARPNFLQSFLARITRNLSINRLEYLLAQKRGSGAIDLFSELDECVAAPQSDPGDICDLEQIGASINNYLRTISDIDRAVFLSRYFYAQSIEEISRNYDMAKGKVRYILSRSRSGLKTQLAKDGVAI